MPPVRRSGRRVCDLIDAVTLALVGTLFGGVRRSDSR
jgi:hypothetical protein